MERIATDYTLQALNACIKDELYFTGRRVKTIYTKFMKNIVKLFVVCNNTRLTSSCCLRRSLYCLSKMTFLFSRSLIWPLRSFIIVCIFLVSVTRLSTLFWSLACPVLTSCTYSIFMSCHDDRSKWEKWHLNWLLWYCAVWSMKNI